MRKSGLINLGFVLGVMVLVGGMSVWLRESVLPNASPVEANDVCPSGPSSPSECSDCFEKHQCKKCCRAACGDDKDCLKDCKWKDDTCEAPTGPTGPSG